MNTSFLKSLMVSVFMFGVVQNINGNSINYRFCKNQADLSIMEESTDSTIYAVPHVNGLESYGNSGMAKLPRKTLHFALPNHASDIILELSNISAPIHIPLSIPVATDRGLMLSTDSNGQKYSYADSASNGESSLVEIFHIEDFRGICQIVSVVVNPVKISSGGIDFYEDIYFCLKYNETVVNDSSTESALEISGQDISFLKDLVENPEIIDHAISTTFTGIRPPKPKPIAQDAYEYTIVTSAELAPAFQRLVALKRIQGYDAGITTTEYIFGCGKYSKGDTISNICDSAGILKAYFLENKDRIKYVLLGGKPPIVPIRYGFDYVGKSYENHIPSDLYYGTDKTDWNWNNSMSRVGEYGSSYSGFNYSSMFKIGRLLCTTQEEVNNYIDKLEIYEINPGFGDRSYLQRGYGHVSTQISSWLATYIGNISDSMSLCFNNSQFSYGINSNHTGSEVIDEMSNNYAFFNIYGHGNPEGISTTDGNLTYGINALDGEGLWQMEESGNGIDNIGNFGKPGVMLTSSCTTVPFDSPAYMGFGKYISDPDILTYNLGESFTLGKNYGGVIYIGNTRKPHTISGQLMNAAFLSNMYNYGNKATVGELVEYVRAQKNYSYYHLDLLGYAIIGDPSVRIWDGNRATKQRCAPLKILRDENLSIISVSLNSKSSNDDSKLSLRPSYSKISFVEPNGRILSHSIEQDDSIIVCKDIHPNSIIYMSGNNQLPYIGDLCIHDNFIFSTPINHLYAGTVVLGNHSKTGSKETDNIVFGAKTVTTIDAYNNITIEGDVTIGENEGVSILTVATPDTCFLNSPLIKESSKIIVYANNVVLGDFTDNETSLSKIDIYPYDRYGVGDNTPAHVTRVKQKSCSDSYKPLLEEGKTWKYSLVNWVGIDYPDYPLEMPVERLRETRLEGYETIGDETYMKLNVYYDGESTPETGKTMYYLKEDTETGLVTMLPNYDFFDLASWEIGPNQRLLYDQMPGYLYNFKSDDDRHFYRYKTISETKVSCHDGEHKCYIVDRGYDDNTNWYVIEGIGLVSDSERHGCSILGESFSGFPSTPDSFYDSYLYEVVNGDGEVIYTNDSRRPGWVYDTDGINDSPVKPNITISTEGILIESISGVEVKLIDAMGRIVSECLTANGITNIHISGVSSGIYILKVGAETLKFVIK